MVVVVVSRAERCVHLLVGPRPDDEAPISGRCRWCGGYAMNVPDDDLDGYVARLDARLRPLGGHVAGRVRGSEN